jgi:hypothetical protein
METIKANEISEHSEASLEHYTSYVAATGTECKEYENRDYGTIMNEVFDSALSITEDAVGAFEILQDEGYRHEDEPLETYRRLRRMVEKIWGYSYSATCTCAANRAASD